MSQTTRPNLPSLIENLSTMQNLVYWVHQRPYYKEIHQDWAQRYNDAARFDIDKLIVQLVEVILSKRITSSQVASSSRITVTPLASRVEGKEGVTKAKPLEAMDKFELLGEVLRSFKWSRKLTDFERAIMLEAVADMRYYWHPKGRPDDFNPREILSKVKKHIEDAPSEPALARNRVVEVRSQLYGNSMGQVVSSLEVFDLLQDRSSGFRPDSLSDFEQLRISDDP
ncbi:hypothetical protein FRC03_005050 [Tulasnella sp. 419]|nr:hypothetical protein FRC03_005050 [Tulasnella sp. 419]